ncbi:hypothetical protein AQ505_08835 [Pedobacter sp. PACM 27299]|uniref:hypothetical protein n=1 Tax=Pedobacter sp. PACM 27299 TaxID=1727164 RepID=UPI00070592C5|nr:hypothetical protein [Pedobacter sp. PACM 27299]ALL05587.1 hypothetical protein AQ505_08835 [Pedobacter sp. PACM 27299]
MKVPVTWKYHLNDSNVHTFQEYEKWKFDIFQLSIRELTSTEQKDQFNTLIEKSEEIELGGKKFYRLDDSVGDDLTVRAWTGKYGDTKVLFTLTHANEPDKDLDAKPIQEKVDVVHEILSGFQLVDVDKRQEHINSYLFDMFIQGVGATALILSKAVENKAFFEATCILGNQIDALLRIGIVLKLQIVNSDMKIEREWIHQGLTDRKKSEKDVYKKALELGVIDQDKLDELYELYDDRNRVIHRFIISDITLAEVEEIAFAYYQIQTSINKIVYDIEAEQIHLGIGMTIASDGEQEEQNNLDYIKGKIGKLDYFDEPKNTE